MSAEQEAEKIPVIPAWDLGPAPWVLWLTRPQRSSSNKAWITFIYSRFWNTLWVIEISGAPQLIFTLSILRLRPPYRKCALRSPYRKHPIPKWATHLIPCSKFPLSFKVLKRNNLQIPNSQNFVVNASFTHQEGTSPPEAAIEATPETTPIKVSLVAKNRTCYYTK